MIVEKIAKETGVSVSALNLFIETASYRYKTYSIPKRTGGERIINHPAPAVKFLQRWIVRNIIAHLPVHSSVMSYKEGVGVIKNADMHVKQNFLLKMDFQDFFPSIKGEDIMALIMGNIMRSPFSELSAEDRHVIVKIACKKNQLTIGAPSSPAISNALLYRFDKLMFDESAKRQVSYSRYADDLTFSTNQPNVLAEVVEIVKKALIEQPSPKLRINFEKTVFASKKRRRVVTGLVLTSESKVSIGREKKREIKALCHQFCKGVLSVDALSYLRGYLSYVHSVEPDFIAVLQAKYGAEVIEGIISATPVKRK